METIDQRSFKEKVESFKMEAKKKLDDCVEFCKKNKEVVIVMAPVVIECSTRLLVQVLRAYGKHEDRINKERNIYDFRHRHYVQSKRKIKQHEWDEIDQRLERGESPGEILKDLGLR